MIRVQREDFDPGVEMTKLGMDRTDVGGVACFVGLVRGESVKAMTLEHYPGMTERQLAGIEKEARLRWPLLDVIIIHRFGRLTPGQRIVMVAVASSHRAAAFAACEFLMDWLKTKAPFWKLEETGNGAHWVDADHGDDERTERWERGQTT